MINKRICYISVILCILSTIAHSKNVSDSSKKDIAFQTPTKSDGPRVDTMCGPNCLWQIAKGFGRDCTPLDIAKCAGTDAYSGTTIKGLLEACKKINLPAVAVQTNLNTLTKDSRIPILLFNTGKLSHYVILDKIDDNQIRILDSTHFREMTISDLDSIWDGYAVLIGNNGNTQPGQSQRYFGQSLQILGLLIILVFIMMRIHLIKAIKTRKSK